MQSEVQHWIELTQSKLVASHEFLFEHQSRMIGNDVTFTLRFAHPFISHPQLDASGVGSRDQLLHGKQPVWLGFCGFLPRQSIYLM
jgi:hypothetical protein